MSSGKGPAPSPPVAVPARTTDKPQTQEDFEIETGGLSEFKKPDHVIQKAVTAVEKELKEKIKEVTKEEAPEKLEIVGYRSNIVLGYMYFAKIQIKGGSFVQARILESPKGEISLQSVTETKTDEDEREYFKLPKPSKK
jgi:hypothetical protein